MALSQLCKSAAAIAAALLSAPAFSADFAYRPDLADHIATLQDIYVPRSFTYGPAANLSSDREKTRAAIMSQPPKAEYSVIHMSGIIEKGDVEKLTALADGNFLANGKYAWVLVMDSPGGNMVEGIRLGEYLHDQLQASDPAFIGSYVLNGTSCMSACALAFSIGSTLGGGTEPIRSRFIEDGATLGFHMGFFAGDKSTELAEIGQIMDVTYDVVQAYARLIEDQTSPPDLLIEALKHRTADSFFEVGATDRARDLGFVPVSAGVLSEPLSMSGVTTELVGQLCRHLLKTSQAPWGYVQDDYAYVQMIDPLPALQPGETFAIPFSVTNSCLISPSAAGNLMISVLPDSPQCADGSYDLPCKVEFPVDFVATNGLLADVSLCHMGKASPLVGTTTQYRDAPYGIGSARAAVKMRANPGTTAQVVGKLAADDRVQMVNCALTPDDQAVWMQVQANGQTGWVSARYIRLQDWENYADTQPTN